MKLIVTKEDTLLNYLLNNLAMPNKTIKNYLKHGIYVNNVKTTKYNYPIFTGMEINIPSKSSNQSELPFPIIYEDDYLIVVNKPANLLTIATTKEKDKTLYHIVGEYLRRTNKNAKVFIIHRLDKDTSGIVVLAKDEKTKNILQENWNDYVSLREYTAVVYGHLKVKEKRIVQKLKETKTNLVYISKDEDAKEAITNYKVLKETSNYSLLSVNIETGRKNQIRVALASLNNPIVGDKKYGDKKDKNERLYLHANRLKMYYPVIKKELLFETTIPTEFKKIMN